MAEEDIRTLEKTPTWAVASVCLVLVCVSIVIEHVIHLIGKWLKRMNKRTLYEALERIKSEIMLLGFMSLLLTAAKPKITNICISKSVADSWLPCNKKYIDEDYEGVGDHNGHDRKLLSFLASNNGMTTTHGRILAVVTSGAKCEALGKVPFLSADALHELHMFIFSLAVFHVVCSILTLALGRAKMKEWKAWELETQTAEYQYTHDPERFRLARDTTFGQRHLSLWSRSPILVWVVGFIRQFVMSVPKVDYMTLRHGFIMAHLAPNSQAKFNFQKYINRSLEEDFKVVVGISPPIWFVAVAFLIFSTNSWKSYLWLPFIPLIVVLLVGTKLQVIITKLALRIQERGAVVKGTPLVEPTDDLFWFKRPQLLLYLIHFVLFQNAFQLAFFAWSAYQFGPNSCFHKNKADFGMRISMGAFVQILCSYVTLPLYALVTQMGSKMKPTVFSDNIVNALHKWHQNAKKQVKIRQSNSTTPASTRPSTPTHLLHRTESSRRESLFHNSLFDRSGSTRVLPSITSLPEELNKGPPVAPVLKRSASQAPVVVTQLAPQAPTMINHHEIDIIQPTEFSFEKDTNGSNV